MAIRPIRNDADLERATAEIDRLWGATEGTEQADRLEVLVILVDEYERRHHPIEAPSPVDAIRFRLEQLGLSEKDLEPFIGTRTRVYEVLTGRRPLTLRMIRNLADGLGVPADVLVGSVASAAVASISRADGRGVEELQRRPISEPGRAVARRRPRRVRGGFTSAHARRPAQPVRYPASRDGDA